MASQVSGQAGNSANNGVPIGTVTAVEANDPTAVMLTYRNYGEVTLHGIDVGVEAALTEKLTVRGAFSKQLDGNFIADFEGVGDLSLNAPDMKFTFGADWRDPKLGFNAGFLFRHIDGFPVRSGVYNGDVPTYTTISFDLGYRIPGVAGLSASLSAQNLLTWVAGSDQSPFTQRHIEFVGTPAIGRLVVGRLAYEF
jgi:iron complex outermembrane receptor protein